MGPSMNLARIASRISATTEERLYVGDQVMLNESVDGAKADGKPYTIVEEDGHTVPMFSAIKFKIERPGASAWVHGYDLTKISR